MQSRSATVAMLAAFLFGAALMALHVVRSDLAPGQHMISEYALGTTRWLMTVAFLTLATSFLALAAAFLPTARGFVGRFAVLLLVVAGVGAAIGGLFPMDAMGTLPEQASTSGKMHGVGFMLGVPGTLLAVTFCSLSLWRRDEWRSSRVILGTTAAAVWIIMIVFGASMATIMSRRSLEPDLLIGWQNRALVLSWATWVFLLAAQLRRTAPAPRHAT